MSENLNRAGIHAMLGAGSIVLNDYALNITQIERGYRLTVTRGSEKQTMDILDGVGIVGIEKTGSTGDVDSYRITFTDGSTFDYNVETNAAAHEAAEAARVEAENSRVRAEADRVSAESVRVAAENARAVAETARANAENERAGAEALRTAAEIERANAESVRVSAEQGRVAAESGRVSAEQGRVAAESGRVAAEEARAIEFAGFSGEITQLKDDVAAITPDDTVVDGKPWTSKKTIDSLCMPIEATGNPVQVYPVEGYPLGVKVSWEPTQEGEGDPSPDNIRPISGRDVVSVTRCGKNLVEHQYAPGYTVTQEGITFTVNDDYSITAKGTATAETYFNFLAIKSEYLIATYNINAMGETVVCNGFEIRDIVVQPYPRDHNTRLYLVITKDTVVDTTYYPMIVYGSTSTPYEPYTGDTYTAELPETVYGGEVDAVSGEGQETWKSVILNGTELWYTWGINANNPAVTGFYTYDINDYDAINVKGICSHLANTAKDVWGGRNVGIGFALASSGESRYFMYCVPSSLLPDISAGHEIASFKAYLAAQNAAGTPVQIAYKLAEPVTFTATGTQPIPALSGVNTLYTDSGDISVSGRTDMIWLTQSLMERIAALETAAVSK